MKFSEINPGMKFVVQDNPNNLVRIHEDLSVRTDSIRGLIGSIYKILNGLIFIKLDDFSYIWVFPDQEANITLDSINLVALRPGDSFKFMEKQTVRPVMESSAKIVFAETTCEVVYISGNEILAKYGGTSYFVTDDTQVVKVNNHD